MDQKTNLALFKHSILRNKKDYTDLKKYYALSYFPDLTFLLPKIFTDVKPRSPNSVVVKHIGVCLAQTFYNPNYKTEYEDFVKNITIFVRKMLNDGYIMHLIPFGIHKNKYGENDVIIMTKIMDSIGKHQNLILEYDDTYTLENYTYKTYSTVAKMDFNICTRFHSHIFSIIHGIPFISLSCSRKCGELMYELDFTNNLYKLETNDIIIPVNFNGDYFYKFVKSRFGAIKDINKKINLIRQNYLDAMTDFEKYWCNLIFKYLTNDKIQLWPPLPPDNCTGPTSPPFVELPSHASPIKFPKIFLDKLDLRPNLYKTQ